MFKRVNPGTDSCLPVNTAAVLPHGPLAVDVWDEMMRSLGVNASLSEGVSDVPAWSDEEAAQFKRVIDDAFEHIEELPSPL